MNIWLGMFETKFTNKFSIQISINGIYFVYCFSSWNSLLKPYCPGTQSNVTLDSQVEMIFMIFDIDTDSFLLFELSVNPLFLFSLTSVFPFFELFLFDFWLAFRSCVSEYPCFNSSVSR